MPVVRSRASSAGLSALALLLIGSFLVAELWAMNNTSYDVWGGMLLGPVLVLISLPLAIRLGRREADPRLARLVVVALALKLVASLARYAMAFVLYDGQADSQAYHDRGTVLAETLRYFVWVEPTGKLPGTGFIEVVTGVVYALIGPTKIGGYLVFSWLGFWGLYLFYRAFATAYPQGDQWRYARLVLLLPSLLFWPSGIGKEAWMMLTLGLTAYGAARLLAGFRGGIPLLAVGLLGAAMVRPHMALIVFVALFAGYLFRPSRRGSLFGPLGKAVMLGGLLLAGTLVLGQTQEFFGVSSSSEADAVLEKTSAQTGQGGSAFTAKQVRTPLDLPMATVNVLIRPFPNEANSAQALVASLEGLFLIGLAVASRRRLAGLPKALLRSPYLTFCLTYTLLFVTAFSSFANFGILTRQRVQVFPFVLVLLCLPQPVPKPRKQVGAVGRPPAREEVPA